MAISQSNHKLDDAFSDEEGSGYIESPTRQSYRPHAISSKSTFSFYLFVMDYVLIECYLFAVLIVHFYFYLLIGHSSPGGDLSDEDICTGFSAGNSRSYGLESLRITSGHMEFPPIHSHNQRARSRSGSCTSRRYVSQAISIHIYNY